ncbi:hypothetical protein SEVIR_4G047700v4 [Setaria viridis]|uniref:Calcineurin-like phosphoesterase domain-containing protein n=1 Tax=Setaria viridis TaxID=4556 RepID=A0A4U6UZS9_SETVI|nr:uncharacterized protein LOC117851755 [Setaria viridis]TKW19869.1 hypothetical protein SEVIR_4G047700v2 [Setaria viridis]
MEGEAVGNRGRQLPWRRTVAVQAALCLALYAAFSIGEPQLFPRGGEGGGVDALGQGARGGGGVAFLSVAGGARATADQARLLRQMEAVAKVYEVKFVLDIAQSRENDPLWQHGSMYFQALNIPWYSTTSSHGRILGNFLKKVSMSHDQVLDVIALDTGALQEPLHDGKISTSYREQTKWLERSLALTSGNWKVVVGYDPLVVCNEAEAPEIMKFYEPFQRIFAKYEVDAYISTGGFCGYFHRDNSMLHIGHPRPGGDHTTVDGFFLHRVTPLEMESVLINVEGKVVQRSVAHQHGTGAM